MTSVKLTDAEHNRLQYRTMLDLSEQMNLGLHTSQQRSSTLQGKCPFHAAEPSGNSLSIREDTGRFACAQCHIRGNALHFTARIWGVSASDARLLLNYLHTQGIPPTPKRPPYPPHGTNGMPTRRDGSPSDEPFPNTALMTQASRHYANNLIEGNRSTGRYFGKIGLDEARAAGAGIGYSTGNGLKEFLLNNGITSEEIEESPLFHANTGAEKYTGRLVFSDKDQTGATLWMFATNIHAENEELNWLEMPPGIYGLPQSAKPFLFNSKSITPERYATMTDDPRLYTVMAAEGLPVLLVTQRNRPNINNEIRYAKTASNIIRREIKALTIVVNDEELAEGVYNTLSQKAPETAVTVLGSKTILENLRPATRDLKKITPRIPEPVS